jgi:hypothetical protein
MASAFIAQSEFNFKYDLSPIIKNINDVFNNKYSTEILKKSEEEQKQIQSGKILREQHVGFYDEFGMNRNWNDDEKECVKKFYMFNKEIMKHIIFHTKYQDNE